MDNNEVMKILHKMFNNAKGDEKTALLYAISAYERIIYSCESKDELRNTCEIMGVK